MGFGTKQADVTDIKSKTDNLPTSPADEDTSEDIEGKADELKSGSRDFIDKWMGGSSGYTITPTVQITGTATDKSLGTLDISAIGLPSGATIKRATINFKYSKRVDDSGSENYLSGTQYIQVQSTGSAVNAMTFVGGELNVAASATEGADAILGDADVKAVVVESGGVWQDIDVTWKNAKALAANIYLKDFQIGIRIWFDIP